MIKISEKWLFSVILTGMIGLHSIPALAVPDEIQVYTDDMDEPGEFGLELHSNFVMRGPKEPGYEGEQPSHHVLQITPEFSYGISKTLEAGLYFPPIAITPDNKVQANGIRLRLKYIAPKEESDTLFWGLNTEFGYSSKRVSESAWNAEIRPIVGYRDEKWLFAFNPILDLAFSDEVSKQPQFEPALKVSRNVGHGLNLGFEYYAALGSLQNLNQTEQHGHSLYIAADYENGPLDVNFGIGRGYGVDADQWVAKMIVSVPLK